MASPEAQFKLALLGRLQNMAEPEDKEIRLITSSRDLDDYDVMLVGNLSAAVPHKAKNSLRRLIWGALVTYQFGNKSVDHVLRQYDYLWQKYAESSKKNAKPHLISIRAALEKVYATSAALGVVTPGEKVGKICAKSALCRLDTTFKAAYGLIRKDYVFETDAVIRLILEQLAWSYSAFDSDDKSIYFLNPTKCISTLKNLMPSAGRLYGQLSETAHIDPGLLHNYLRFYEEGIPVVRRSEQNAISSGKHLLELAVAYCHVVQTLFSPYSIEQYADISTELIKLFEQYQADG